MGVGNEHVSQHPNPDAADLGAAWLHLPANIRADVHVTDVPAQAAPNSRKGDMPMTAIDKAEVERVAADEMDVCECGDYRRDHVLGVGACRFNSREFDLCHCGQDCHRFRLAVRQRLMENGNG